MLSNITQEAFVITYINKTVITMKRLTLKLRLDFEQRIYTNEPTPRANMCHVKRSI